VDRVYVLLKLILPKELDPKGEGLPHAIVIPGKVFEKKSVDLPYKSFDENTGEYRIEGVPYPAYVEAFAVGAGIDVMLQFIEKGKKAAAPSTDYYWVQYVQVGTTVSQPNAKDAEVPGAWGLEKQSQKNKKNQPNYYILQEDLTNHPLKDSPTKPLPGQVLAQARDTDKKIVTISFAKAPSEVVAEFKKAIGDKKIVQTWKYETYLVKTGKDEPMGYVTWGLSVTLSKDGESVTKIGSPEWNAGKDDSVWGKAK
jgi:hypothetical protein